MYDKCLILLSGGTGRRMGSDIPKQYIEINKKMILEYTLQTMSAWNEMDSLVIVAAYEWRERIRQIADRVFSEAGNEFVRDVSAGLTDGSGEKCEEYRKRSVAKFLGFAAPGENRELSILNAMNLIRDSVSDDAVIMIHDAVRPCVSPDMIKLLADACRDHDGAMPYLEMKDTVYESADGIRISRNLDRSTIVAGQTPEAFRFGKYLSAVESLSRDEILKVHGSTEPAVAAGMDIALVPGDEGNFKITTPQDLRIFENAIKDIELSEGRA